MALKNVFDSLKNTLFPPSYADWISRSHAFGEVLKKNGSAAASQWFPLDRLRFAPFSGEILNDSHRQISEAKTGHQGSDILIDLGIEGYLRREDALKLYELAFKSQGNVLEAGTNKGLSTSIIAQALHDKGVGRIETIELDRANSEKAKANLASRAGFGRVTFTVSDATARMTELAKTGQKYGFIFIDHWHGYQATVEAAELVKQLLLPSGYVMFHDFLDPGNANRRHVYGVYQAVLDTIVLDERFEFAGTSGCCAIFRMKDYN